MNIDFDPNIPNEILKPIQELLKEVNWLFPQWLRTLYIDYVGQIEGSEGAAASVSVNYPYRYAVMTFTSDWVGLDDFYRLKTFYHEVIHISLMPFHDYALNEIDRLLEHNEAHRDSLHDTLVDLMESSIQDFSYLITDKMESINSSKVVKSKSVKTAKPAIIK